MQPISTHPSPLFECNPRQSPLPKPGNQDSLAGPPSSNGPPPLAPKAPEFFFFSLNLLAPKARKKNLPQTVEREEGGGRGCERGEGGHRGGGSSYSCQPNEKQQERTRPPSLRGTGVPWIPRVNPVALGCVVLHAWPVGPPPHARLLCGLPRQVPIGTDRQWLLRVLQEVKALERLHRHANIIEVPCLSPPLV